MMGVGAEVTEADEKNPRCKHDGDGQDGAAVGEKEKNISVCFIGGEHSPKSRIFSEGSRDANEATRCNIDPCWVVV